MSLLGNAARQTWTRTTTTLGRLTVSSDDELRSIYRVESSRQTTEVCGRVHAPCLMALSTRRPPRTLLISFLSLSKGDHHRRRCILGGFLRNGIGRRQRTNRTVRPTDIYLSSLLTLIVDLTCCAGCLAGMFVRSPSPNDT